MLRLAIAASMLVGCAAAEPPGSAAAAASDPVTRSIEGIEWRAVEIGGSPVVGPAAVTLRLDGGRAAGSGGCNGYGGPYRFEEGGRLSFGPLVSTRRACADEAGNRQESAFHRILAAVSRYRIDRDGSLLLSAEDGSTVRFQM